MGCPSNDNAVWARRSENNVVILCTRKEANDWWNGPGGKERTQIKNNHIKGWGVSTVFWRFCLIPDGPPMFWQVAWFKWIDATQTTQRGKRFFETIEAALEFHASIMATLRKGVVPEGTSEEEESIAGEVVQPGFVDDEDEEDEDDEDEPRDSSDWWKE